MTAERRWTLRGGAGGTPYVCDDDPAVLAEFEEVEVVPIAERECLRTDLDGLTEAANGVVMAFLTRGPLQREDIRPLVEALDRLGER